jgi:5'/3'-nucleotidase SurE
MTSPLRILVSNDDGVHAPGLEVAEKIARALTDDVWTVVPETEQSGASHSLTVTVPLRIREIGPRKFAIQGTPTDCVMMAVMHIMKDNRPTLVLSGVNRGANLADDVTYSGTVAAAMEGTALGIPSIALSQVFNYAGREGVDWSSAETHGPAIVKRLVEIGWPEGVLININFPNLPADKVTRVSATYQGQRDPTALSVDERVDARGFPYFWIAFRRNFGDPPKGSDLRAAADGEISVTPLHLNLTEFNEQKRLAGFLRGPIAQLE